MTKKGVHDKRNCWTVPCTKVFAPDWDNLFKLLEIKFVNPPGRYVKAGIHVRIKHAWTSTLLACSPRKLHLMLKILTDMECCDLTMSVYLPEVTSIPSSKLHSITVWTWHPAEDWMCHKNCIRVFQIQTNYSFPVKSHAALVCPTAACLTVFTWKTSKS